MSILAGSGLSALPFNRKHFPPCLSRLMPAPFPPSTPEGAKAKTPWQASAHRYQIGDKSSLVSREGQELAAAGGIQMCEDPGLQPCPWGAQPAHPASSWKAPLNHDSMKKQAWQKWALALFLRRELSECETGLLLVLWHFCFCSAGLLLMAFSGCCRLREGLKKKSLTFVFARSDLWLLIWLC